MIRLFRKNHEEGEVPNYTDVREGMGFLLDQVCLGSVYWHDRDHKHVQLDQHPFGLEIELPANPGHLREVNLVAWPGGTDISVKGMALMLAHELNSNSRGENPFRLRITRVQARERLDQPGEFYHDLYFELICWNGVFIAGGCNDYSGTGGSGGRTLESIFKAAALISGIVVEETVVPLGRAEEIARALSRAYGVREERHGAA